jgi:uncharacterized membrane protein
MKLFLQKFSLVAAVLVSLLAVNFSQVAYADCSDPNLSTTEAIRCGSFSAAGTTVCDSSQGTKKVNDTITEGINLLSVIAGVVAVVMIIMAGFRYITSNGDSAKVGSAKNTLLYAIIGLVIVALSQMIVKFVLNKAT